MFRLSIYYHTHLEQLPDAYTIASVSEDESENDRRASQHAVLLIKLWKFADAYLMPRLQNKAMQEWCRMLDLSSVDADMIRAAFEGTDVDSRIRHAIVHEALYDWSTSWAQSTVGFPAMMDLAGATPGVFHHFFKEMSKTPRGDINRPSMGENREQYKVEGK